MQQTSDYTLYIGNRIMCTRIFNQITQVRVTGVPQGVKDRQDRGLTLILQNRTRRRQRRHAVLLGVLSGSGARHAGGAPELETSIFDFYKQLSFIYKNWKICSVQYKTSNIRNVTKTIHRFWIKNYIDMAFLSSVHCFGQSHSRSQQRTDQRVLH